MKKQALLVLVMVLLEHLALPDTMKGSVRQAGGEQSEITQIEQVIQLALDQNPAVRAAESAWQAALQEIPVAAAWPEPSLSLVQFIEPVETRNGPQRQQIGVNQMLPIWGTIGLKRSISYQKAQKAKQDYEGARIQVVSQVKSVWADLYWLDTSLQILEQYQDVVRTFQDIAEVRYSTGKGMQTSVLKSQLEISTLEEKRINFRKMRQTMAHKLNGLINRPIDAPVRTVDI
ncbi:MAG TPA: TolC family protein, partial [bacterium]|nr:TolC family protein [bacterium]